MKTLSSHLGIKRKMLLLPRALSGAAPSSPAPLLPQHQPPPLQVKSLLKSGCSLAPLVGQTFLLLTSSAELEPGEVAARPWTQLKRHEAASLEMQSSL